MLKKIILAVVSVSLMVGAAPVRAFSISPTKGVVTIDAGATAEVKVTVKNTEAEPGQFSFSAVGVRQDAAGHTLIGSYEAEGVAWVRPAIPVLTLDPGEARQVSFVIEVPAGVSPGTRSIGLVVTERELAAGANQVEGQLVMVLALQVAGVVTESLVIYPELRMSGVTWNEVWRSAAQLKNTGTIEVPLAGIIEAHDWQGKILHSEPLRLGNKLLPGTLRTVQSTLRVHEARYPGRYRLVVKVRYGETHQEIFGTISLWYFPKWSVAIGAIGMALGSWFIVKTIRQRRARRFEQLLN